MSQILLHVKHLACERGYRPLFRGLSFELYEGDIVRIAGPNGAGKSTLLKILCGLSRNFDGELEWSRDSHDSELSRVYLGHQQAVKKILTPKENLEWFASLYPCKKDLTIENVLERVGLAAYADTPCRNLSAGQQQRVAFSRLLLSDAKVWILDEPFTAIDKSGVREFELLIDEFVSQRGSVLLTTHNEPEFSSAIKVVDLGSFQ